jgi:hypothetical protein
LRSLSRNLRAVSTTCHLDAKSLERDNIRVKRDNEERIALSLWAMRSSLLIDLPLADQVELPDGWYCLLLYW